MDVTEIPFAKYVGIKKKEEGVLKLYPSDDVQNHMQTVHAAAQFALAETQSGLHLQRAFLEYEGKVVPLLRGSTVKYKNLATKSIYASAHIDDDVKEKFLRQLERKGRASIIVQVEVHDEEGVITMQGEFNWFVQRI